jgi:hypothetical protein
MNVSEGLATALQTVATEAVSIELFTALIQDSVDALLQPASAGKLGSSQASKAVSKLLQISRSEVADSLNAYVFVLLESAKLSLTATDLEQALSAGVLAENQRNIFSAVYGANKHALTLLLSKTSFRLPHYVNLSWRLEVVLASRALLQQSKPNILLQLETTTTESKQQQHQGDKTETVLFDVSFAVLNQLEAELNAALDDSKTTHAQRLFRYVH